MLSFRFIKIFVLLIFFNNNLLANVDNYFNELKAVDIVDYSKYKQVDMEHKEILLNFEDLLQDTVLLCNKIPKNKWKGIIGVARGGLFAALLASHVLEIYNIETISLKSYDDVSKSGIGRISLLNNFDFQNKENGEGWLVIDDLVDSGSTIKWIKEKLPKAYYAVVYAKHNSVNIVDSYGVEMPQEVWIVFPWEIIKDKK